MKSINVGLIGSGFSAELHLEGYEKVYGVNVHLKAVASTNQHVDQFAQKHGIEKTYRDYKELLKDPDIDVVDICTPVLFHEQMIIDSIEAGKHVICEKPITGYTGNQDENVGRTISKKEMYKSVVESLERMKQTIEGSDRLFMYAENWIYAPSILKSVEILRAKKNKILFMLGEESHSGSHATHAAQWNKTGGGSLIRQGCHPLSAILYLKKVEAEARGEKIEVESVIADVGVVTKCLSKEEMKHIAVRPVDVEDLASLNLTFTDGTKATILSGDMIVGGARNYVQLFNNDGAMICNISPNDAMLSYSLEEKKLENVYITEKVETKRGWQNVFISEEIMRGYVGEIQDFMECVTDNRAPLSDFDIAYDTLKVIYAGYLSADEGRKVYLNQ